MRTMSVLKIAFLSTAALELLAALSIALLAVYCCGFWFNRYFTLAKKHGACTLPVRRYFYCCWHPNFMPRYVSWARIIMSKPKPKGAIAELSPLLALRQLKHKANPFYINCAPCH
ncbi:MAG: hypothetical protein U1E98_05105 [Moraxella osloensis]